MSRVASDDGTLTWRLVYCVAADAIVVLDVFAKKTTATPKQILAECRERLAAFERAVATKKRTGHARR